MRPIRSAHLGCLVHVLHHYVPHPRLLGLAKTCAVFSLQDPQGSSGACYVLGMGDHVRDRTVLLLVPHVLLLLQYEAG